jgi:SSS family solute:Na+ symporter
MNGVTLHTLDWVAIAAYFIVVVGAGLWFARYTKTTKDFFFGGQRFAWWLVAISCVATLVGSYSFINYSEVGFNFGFASVTNYTNEWFVLPFFLIGWLPVIYFSGVVSIPEYFERRFDRRTRLLVLVLLMIYLEGYIGINLLTIGVAMKGLFGWNVIASATVIAIISALYLHAGGQTSVLMTDLLQGFLLLAAGLGVFFLGLAALGGWQPFWDGLPAAHRLPFAQFNKPASFHFVGEFWGDAMTGTFAFYCINQGVLMRFLSAKSVRDGRKAMLLTAAVLMPLAAVAVGGAGWIGRAMVGHGMLPADTSAREVFIQVARAVAQPGMFGFVIAAMIAALMSTLDTLISAVSAIAVNDVWKTMRPGREDSYYLGAARHAALAATVVGIFLIPLFQKFHSIYQALSHFTAVITPPLCAAILLGVVWPRFSSRAAFWTLVCASGAMITSMLWPVIITPLAHGVSPEHGFSYMRSLYGVVASLGFGIFFGYLWGDDKAPEGLTLSTLSAAKRAYKGAEPSEKGVGEVVLSEVTLSGTDVGRLHVPAGLMQELHIAEGDLLHVGDHRWWLGGLLSIRLKAGPAAKTDAAVMSQEDFDHAGLISGNRLRIEKLM